MFGTIRKHQTWLWAIIITLTIISFVIFFSPYSKLNDSRRGPVRLGSIEGQKISEEQFMRAQREAYLHFFFMSGRWPDEDAKRTGFDPERETYQWLFLNQKAEQMGIYVSTDTVADTAKEMLGQFQRSGITGPQAFVKQVLEPRGFTPEDFERFVRHYLGIQELISLIGMSGKLVTPEEAKSLYVREHQDLSAEAVFFSVSNYLANVTVSPEALSQFYSNRLAEYRIPERVQVKYVEFGISNLLSQAEADLTKTNLSELIDMNFQRLGTNYTRFGKTPEEAKAKIKEEMIRGKALAEARKQAAAFADELFNKEPVKAENLEVLAKEKRLTVKTSAPFDRQEPPKDLDVGADFAKAAFSRTPEDPFAAPIVGRDAVYLIAIDKKLPSQVPPLDQIRDRVTADYKHNQAIVLARQAGVAFHQTLTNALASGKSFAAVCTEAKHNPVTLPPFSLSTRSLPPQVEDQITLNELKQMAFATAPGKASQFEPTSDGGAILYVKAKLPVDEAKLKADLPSFMNYVRQNRQSEAFNEWFRKEASQALRDTPLGQPRPAPSLGAAAAGKS